ncbi:DNA modification methylase [Terrisporobacter glycolicus]|uniref:DNA modification methylase n=1 Tax=Terrisporobacter glycolicus TaxID=36841 RepID=UPI003463C21E
MLTSLVSYPERGKEGNNKYRGNCSPKLIYDLHKFYKFDAISDYMVGSGTVEEVAHNLNIKSNVYDLNKGYDLMQEEIQELNNFIFWHPPYWDIIKYSGYQYGQEVLPNDLSHIKDYKEFTRALNYCLAKQFSSLKLGGRMAILMGDIKRKGKLYSMLLDIHKIGTIENIIVKSQHNTFSENIKYKSNSFIPIVHEYLLILRRDEPYLFNLKITKDIELDIRDSEKISWKDVVVAAYQKLGGKAKFESIYEEISGHRKVKSNPNWKAKIRQVVQTYDKIFTRVNRGEWQLLNY